MIGQNPSDPCQCREPPEHTIKGIPLKGTCGVCENPHYKCSRQDWIPLDTPPGTQ